MSIAFLGGAEKFAEGFVPIEVRHKSITYVRITAFSALGSTIETAVAAATRALDKPDVPLVLSSAKFAVNILLDMLLISNFHVGNHAPTANLQASIQLACNLISAFAGLAYFLLNVTMSKRRHETGVIQINQRSQPSMAALMVLVRPGISTFIESAVRNALYLWLVHNIISLGSTYATAWGVFNTIRWGLIMVPVSALEATTLTFVGHNWARWRHEIGITNLHPRASLKSLYHIAQPAVKSVVMALIFEVPICIFISVFGAREFARFLSGNDEVARVVARMWRTIDWCYILYAVSTQLAAILLATRPKWFLWQSLAANLLYVLPWAIVCQVVDLDEDNAWTYHALVFGGSLVFSFVCVPAVLSVWVWVLKTGKAHLEVFRE